MEKAFSDSDVSKYVKNVIVYSQLKKIDPKELLKLLPVAILYQATPNFGHWTLLLKTPKGIEFFDSYGYQPDMEFKFLKYKQPHYLAKLLMKLSDIVEINYSPYKFQSTKQGVNTCGRWIIVRNYFSNWDIDKFAEVIFRVSNKLKLTPDQLVVKLLS